MLADRSDRLSRIDARLTALHGMLADAVANDYTTVEMLLRKRIDTVLETRLSELRSTR